MPDEQSLITGQIITELPASADVVIIGGGIVGAASAFWLARAGRSVRDSGARKRTCHRHDLIFCPLHPAPSSASLRISP